MARSYGERTDLHRVDEADVVRVLRRAGEGEHLMFLAQPQVLLLFESIDLEIVVLKELHDALACLGPEVPRLIERLF